ncbi:hypothetical protein AUR64_19025 [Haloprofundus marisrubri]|uniref:Uncharacterized protein n=1 Tax=Haloprofundus marisrubri TaxID=1514971 RepID=A0A0W1R4K3_9EURY|nr:hypothetical protein [Haloprofundus marisrubri]KTG08329.1 hypothetical protein AUR64_19025 [Haloprofundus marisrubri]
MTGYYDYVLGLIPLVLFGVTAILTTAGVGLTTAVPIAAIGSVGIMGHALFVNGPVESQPGAVTQNTQSQQLNAD